MRWLAITSILAAGCEDAGRLGMDGAVGPRASADAAPDAFDPQCHYDCFGRTDCHDGRVTQWANTPVPCQYWTGQCPVEQTLVCTQGCLVDGADVQQPWFQNLAALCRETPPARRGRPVHHGRRLPAHAGDRQ